MQEMQLNTNKYKEIPANTKNTNKIKYSET